MSATLARSRAFARVAGLYLLIQTISYAVLRTSCSPSTAGDVWLYGAIGPLAAVEAIPRLPSHSVFRNAAFIIWCVVVLVAPFIHVIRPRRWTLVASILALAIWCLFGLGFTIRHM